VDVEQTFRDYKSSVPPQNFTVEDVQKNKPAFAPPSTANPQVSYGVKPNHAGVIY